MVPRPARVDPRAARGLRENDIRSGSTSWSSAAIDVGTRRASYLDTTVACGTNASANTTTLAATVGVAWWGNGAYHLLGHTRRSTDRASWNANCGYPVSKITIDHCTSTDGRSISDADTLQHDRVGTDKDSLANVRGA